MQHAKLNDCKRALLQTLPVMAGYVFLGFAFGLLLRTQGFPAWYPVLMSFVIYSGAMEYAAIPMLTAAFDPLGSFLLGLTISARHLFYGIPMLKHYANAGKAKPFLIFGLTDETFSVLTSTAASEGSLSRPYCFFVTLFDYLYWTMGTLLGAVAGGLLSFRAEGLDFALTALFIVLFLEQLKDKNGRISGATGLIVSLVVLILFGSDKLVLISIITILVLLLAEGKVLRLE